MDSGTAITGLVLVVISIVPIFVLNGKRSKKGRGMLQSITKVASEHNCKITEHEFCGDYTIGMDKTNGYVFFVKESNAKADVQFVNLAQVRTSKIENTSRIVTNNKQNNKITERLRLNLLLKEKDKSTIVWEFYNAEENPQLNGELQSIEKWQNTINNYLNG